MHHKFLSLPALACLAGCSPFSDMQTGRVLEKGEREVTPYVSTILVGADGGTEQVQTGYGVIAGIGLTDDRQVDLRFRYERIEFDGIDQGFNVFSAGPKFRIGSDVTALYIPVGFGVGNDLDFTDTWETQPTFLATTRFASWVETTASVKGLIRLTSESDPSLAFNLGAQLGPDPQRFALHPEVGVMIAPETSGPIFHIGVGITVGFGEPHDPPTDVDSVRGFAFHEVAYQDVNGILEVSGVIVNRDGVGYERATFTVVCSDAVGGVLGSAQFELSNLEPAGERPFGTTVPDVDPGQVAHCRLRFDSGVAAPGLSDCGSTHPGTTNPRRRLPTGIHESRPKPDSY